MNSPNDTAVQRAATGGRAWRSVVHAQRAAEPDHIDFYALACEAVDTLRSLASLAALLTYQIATYDRGRTLRDDEAGHDPIERLAIASSWAAQLRRDLDAAERSANQLWSEVGHIAVEVSDEH